MPTKTKTNDGVALLEKRRDAREDNRRIAKQNYRRAINTGRYAVKRELTMKCLKSEIPLERADAVVKDLDEFIRQCEAATANGLLVGVKGRKPGD